MSEEVKLHDSNEEKSKKGGLYILIIIALLILSGFLGWKLSSKNKEINELTFQNKDLNTGMNEMNELMYEQGVEAGEDLKTNLENMLADYESMEMLNTDLNDSIVQQKENIINILAELEKEKKNKRYYYRKVINLEQETETLRSIMKSYVHTIDSLNTENLILRTDLSNTRTDLSNVIRDRDDIQTKADDLSKQVNAGSKLTVNGILTEGIKERSSGSFKETTKAKRCTHIRSCFTVGANKIAGAGNKTIYMRILFQNSTVLYASNGNTFTTESGKKLVYADKKTINYQNQAVDVCIFYKLAQELAQGNYTAELWCEGVMIGKNSFVLK